MSQARDCKREVGSNTASSQTHNEIIRLYTLSLLRIRSCTSIMNCLWPAMGPFRTTTGSSILYEDVVDVSYNRS